jgi:hypothetical protein
MGLNEQGKPFDPSERSDADRIPAKIWELLRRNLRFHLTVQQLKRADEIRRSRKPKPKRQRTARAARTLFRRIQNSHPLAACALQWLVPDPLFVIREVALPAGGVGSPEIKRIGHGTTANPADKRKWKWFKSRRIRNGKGLPLRRGPTVTFQTSDTPALCDQVDGLKEWREFFENSEFTVDTPWSGAPPGFRRAFVHLWFQFAPGTRAANAEHDEPRPHESNFFEDWSLFSLINRLQQSQPAREGEVSQSAPKSSLALTDLERGKVTLFEMLSKEYRAFLIPRTLLTKEAARAAFRKLVRNAVKHLPHNRELFGTSGQWRDFLCIEQLVRESNLSRQKAIHEHLKTGGYSGGDLTAKRQAHETDVTHRLAYIEQLRDSIYPGFDVAELVKPMAHRRTRR